LYLNLPKIQLSKLQHIQNFVPVPLLQLPGRPLLIIFSNLFTGSKFRNVSNIKLFPLLMTFCSFQTHSTFVIPSPYSLHVLLGH